MPNQNRCRFFVCLGPRLSGRSTPPRDKCKQAKPISWYLVPIGNTIVRTTVITIVTIIRRNASRMILTLPTLFRASFLGETLFGHGVVLVFAESTAEHHWLRRSFSIRYTGDRRGTSVMLQKYCLGGNGSTIDLTVGSPVMIVLLQKYCLGGNGSTIISGKR